LYILLKIRYNKVSFEPFSFGRRKASTKEKEEKKM
jgi:hypothetical protein